MKYHSLKQRFEPYTDVLIFMITLLVANYAWKWTFAGDEDGSVVTWLGMDVTAPFAWMASHIANVVYGIVSFFRDTAHMTDAYTIHFDSGTGNMVIWGCTGLKQSFIWFCLILTVRGGWKHKLWYIPFGWLCCYLFNIARIAAITLIVEFHPDWFVPMHDYVFKYAFYAMLFGLWVVFVEKLRSAS